jgi:hypothetical protein
MTGVGDLVQRIGNGRTGLHHARVDEKRGFLG